MNVELSKGDVLITQDDDDSKFMFVVLEGKLSAKKTVDEKVIDLGTFQKGDIFGEISMILGTRRAATVTSVANNTQVEKLDKESFIKKIKNQPELAWNVISKLAKKTKMLDEIREQFLNIQY